MQKLGLPFMGPGVVSHQAELLCLVTRPRGQLGTSKEWHGVSMPPWEGLKSGSQPKADLGLWPSHPVPPPWQRGTVWKAPPGHTVGLGACGQPRGARAPAVDPA